MDNLFCWDIKKGESGTPSDFASTAKRPRALLAAKLKHHAAGVSNVILVIAEALRGSAQAGAVELRHDVLNLDRLDRDVPSQVDVQTAAGRSRECILCLLQVVGTAPRVRATEQELQIRCPARKMAQIETGAKRYVRALSLIPVRVFA